MFGEVLYPKLANVQNKIVFLRMKKRKKYIWIYIYIYILYFTWSRVIFCRVFVYSQGDICIVKQQWWRKIKRLLKNVVSFMFLVSILNFKLGLIFPTLPLIFTCNCTVGHQIWIVWKLHCCWIAVHLWQSSALSEINAMQYILTMWELGADLSSPPWNHPQGLKNLPQKCCGGARGRAGSPRSCQECPTAVSTSWWQYHFFCSFCFVLGFLVVVVYLYFSALFLNLLWGIIPVLLLLLCLAVAWDAEQDEPVP